jgi:phenylacetate-CoA ligase
MITSGTQRISKSLPLAESRKGVGHPKWFSHIASDFIRIAIYPILLRRLRPLASRYWRELRKYEFAPREAVERIQWQRLQIMLQHAAQHVPYYRDLFREHGIEPPAIRSFGDLARIPVLTKSTLQARVNDLLAENKGRKNGYMNASGGSTGKPVQFYQDQPYWEHAQACTWFVEEWWGIRPGDRTGSVWGCDRDIPELHWKERLLMAVAQLRVCNAFALTEPEMERFAQMLTAWQPRYLIGYASALEVFARFVLERPQWRIRPHAIKATADLLTDERRSVIERAFGCPVYNFYGSREVNNLAAECPARRGLHVNALTRYIEIVDDAGNPLPPGVPGRILLTDLTNFFMPFLRYEIEDIGSWSTSPCSCGRPFPLLARVWGRSGDFIVTPTGKLIHSVFFTHLFYDMPEVALFQIEQKSLKDISVSLVLRPGTKEYPSKLLHERLQQAFGPSARFQVSTVPKIERPPSGKHRFAVSSVPVPWGAAHLSPLGESKVGEHHEP